MPLLQQINSSFKLDSSLYGQEGYYIGSAPDHYRCYQVYISSTNGIRIAETVEFFPAHCRMPTMTATDKATLAATQLIDILQTPQPNSPFPSIGDKQMQALSKLAQIFQHALPTPSPMNTPPAPRVEKQPTPPAPRVEEPPSPPPQPQTSRVPHQYPLRSRTTTVTSDQPRYPLRSRSWGHRALAAFLHQANPVFNPKTGKEMEYRHLIQDPEYKWVWTKSFANELGRLAQGVGNRIEGTNTITFIAYTDVPDDRVCTYGRIVCELRPQKEEKECTRLTVGGNLIDYPGDTSTETTNLLMAKLLMNSVISTPGAKFMGINIKNFYLNTPMQRPEFMKLPIKLIPQEIIDQYNLMPLVHNGYIYIRIDKGMYGLPQAGRIAWDLLKERLAKHGYRPTKHTPGLWKHDTRPIWFCPLR